MKLTNMQQKVFDALKEKGSTEFTTYRELGEETGIKHPYSVQQAVNALYKKGLLHRDTANNFLINKDINISEDQQFDTLLPTGWFRELVDMVEKLPDEHNEVKAFIRSGRHFL